ncbi:MAG TPA: YfhO family protein, partial [bacterium]
GPHFLPLRLLPAKALEILEPSKAVGLFIFCACTSVAITFSRLLENHKPKKNWRPWLWAAGAFWALDILVLPFRLIHWVPNPYQDPCIDQTWRTFAPKIEGFRAVSLQLPNQWTSNHLEQLSQENAKLLMMNTNVFWGIRSANGYLSTQTQALSNLAKYFMKGFPYRGDLLDVAGAKFLILPQIPPGGKYKVVGRAWEDYILFNPNAAPRGWPVSDTEYFPGRRAILQALAGTGNSWRQKVFLENTSDGTPIALEPVKRDLTPSNPETGLATRMAFNADIQKPGYWVFNETWAPGWHAWVDENPRPLLRAYGLFMAVPVSEGKHRVEFRYEPTSFRLGLFLVFLSLPLLGVIFYRRDKPSTVKTTISI